jgi:hypothetical protein
MGLGVTQTSRVDLRQVTAPLGGALTSSSSSRCVSCPLLLQMWRGVRGCLGEAGSSHYLAQNIQIMVSIIPNDNKNSCEHYMAFIMS